jgi:hypothetical protein
MNRYRLLYTRDCSDSAYIEVEADNIDDAHDKAYQIARYEDDVKWEPDDWCGKPYCPDPEACQVFDPASGRFTELREE